MRLKTSEQRKMDNLRNAIKSVLWKDFWADYKVQHGVSGLEAAKEVRANEFAEAWEQTPYAKAKSYDALVKVLAEDGYTAQDMLNEAEEIQSNKQKYQSPPSPSPRSEYSYEDEEGYEPVY